MRSIFRAIDAETDRFVSELTELLRIPSVSARGESMRPCAEALARHARSVGLDATLLDTGGPPALLATSPSIAGKRSTA